jgi:hypothetical protein
MALVACSTEVVLDGSVGSGRLFSLVDVLLEYLAWPKCNDSPGGNPNLFSGPGVASLSGAFAPHDKISKACDLNRFSLLQYRLEEIQHEFDDISRFIFRDPNLFKNFLSDIRLSHAISPLRDDDHSPLSPLRLSTHCGKFVLSYVRLRHLSRINLVNAYENTLVFGEQFIFDTVDECLPGCFDDVFGDAYRPPFVFMVTRLD